MIHFPGVAKATQEVATSLNKIDFSDSNIISE